MREDGRMKAVGRYERIESATLVDKETGYVYPHCYILTGNYIPEKWEIGLVGGLHFNEYEVKDRETVANIRSTDDVITFMRNHFIPMGNMLEKHIVKNADYVSLKKDFIDIRIDIGSTFLKIDRNHPYVKDMLIFPNLYFDWAENCRQVFEKQEEQIDPIEILKDLRSDFELMSDDDLITNREELLGKISCCLDALENEVELVDMERD